MTTTTTDPIADMLSRIRNAIAVNKPEVSMPHSKIKESVATVLKGSNFVDNVSVAKDRVGKILTVTINNPDDNARITEIVRLSTPGRRQYAAASEMPKVKQGRGIIIVSTSRGVMTGAQAQTKKVGGELICRVY